MNFISNDFFVQNIKSFSLRFPELAQQLKLDAKHPAQTKKHIEEIFSDFSRDFQLENAKNGEPTVIVNGKYLHSKYNPSSEATKTESAIKNSESQLLVFMGLGLGYQPLAFAKKRPETPILIIEPNPLFIYLSLASLPLGELFSHEKLFIYTADSLDFLGSLLSETKAQSFSIIEQPNIQSTSSIFFSNAKTLITRIQTKNEINTATRKRFASLWTRNICKNLPYLKTSPGIYRFKNLAKLKEAESLKVLVLAAGPSLDNVLPFLKELKDRMIIVCVDTALRACLAQGVEPDFIILIDPQYWNSRHITDLKSPSSILITESATFPSVFRFDCKKIFLSSSLFPLGEFLEEHSEKKGTLAAGGSVATSAWDFARLLNPDKIFIAGLDLSYPKGNTHFKGSLFEETAICTNDRFSAIENSSCEAKFSGGKIKAQNFLGEEVKTDKRLKMYAWWFESKLAEQESLEEAENKNSLQESFIIGKAGLAIPGMKTCEVEDLLKLPINRNEITKKLSCISLEDADVTIQNAFDKALKKLYALLLDLKKLAETGLADKSEKTQLDITKKILENPARDLVSMMYFDEENETQEIILKKILEATNFHLGLLKF